MTAEEGKKKRRNDCRMQDEILGETSTNLTEQQREERRKKLFNVRKEYLGEKKSVNAIMPLVSVCIPTYQHKNFIEDCLKGALMQQTSFPYEIVICDDGSIDGTADICRTYAEKHQDKIRLYDHRRFMTLLYEDTDECNVVGRFNWQWTLESARGKYIALCEGDDYWTDPLKLQKQVDFLEANPDFAICFHNVKVWKEQEQEFVDGFIVREVPEITDIYELAKENFIHTPSVVFRKNESAMETFLKMNNWSVGDYPLHLLNAQYGKIGRLNGVMAVYRIHKGGVFGTKEAEYIYSLWIDLIENLKMLFKDSGIIQNLNIQKSECAIHLCIHYWEQDNESLAEYYYNIALKYSPNNLFKSINGKIITLQNNYKQISKSKAYRLGKFLLKPFSYFRNKLK